MLTHLHVKNLAVVEDIEVDFSEGLNIITGETGAGKCNKVDFATTLLQLCLHCKPL